MLHIIDQTPICKQVIPLLRLKKDSVPVGINKEEYDNDGQKGRPRFSFK